MKVLRYFIVFQLLFDLSYPGMQMQHTLEIPLFFPLSLRSQFMFNKVMVQIVTKR